MKLDTLNIKLLTAIAFIVFAFSFLISNTPQDSDYHLGADEGTYYRQANIIVNDGFSGIKQNVEFFVKNPDNINTPHPMRFLHLLFISAFLTFHNSIGMLSLYSTICYVLFLLMSMFYIRKLWNTDVALITTVLLCVSPLGLALSRRALADCDYYRRS